MTTITPYRSDQRPGPDGFTQLLHAEWTKFRTVRGWVIGMIVAVVVAAGIGLLAAVGPANPRWLRLTRAGDVITGYDSADGTHWTKVSTVTLPGLPSTVQAGLFAASPDYNQETQTFGGGVNGASGPTQATSVI